MTSYELCSITAVSDSFFFLVLSLFCGARHINNNNNTESLHSISIGLCTTHLDRVKTFVRGVQRDFPEGPFPETRNFFVPIHPLLARFGVLPFDEDRRADRRHGGRRKLDRPAQPLARAARSLGADSHRFLFVSIVPAFPSAAFGEWWAESRNSIVVVLGKGRSRGTIYSIIWSVKAGCCSCFLLK